MSYYNTTNESGTDLNKSVKQTKKQDALIMEWFERNPYKQITALQLADELGMLFTSCRRSVTNLVDDKKLTYCGMVVERYGKRNHLICLKIEVGQTKLFND